MEQLLNSKVAVKVVDRPSYKRDDQREGAFCRLRYQIKLLNDW